MPDTFEAVRARTDAYFNKTSEIVAGNGDAKVTYAVFLRRDAMLAPQLAIDFLEANYPAKAAWPLEIAPAAETGALIDAGRPLLHVAGSLAALAPLETLLLQKLGWACVCARNAYEMARALPRVAIIDMHPRHATGDDMTQASAYGAAVGTRTARLLGSSGFIGTSQTLTAGHYGAGAGIGTMPHALIGYAKARLLQRGDDPADATLEAAKLYAETFPDESTLTVLVDYDGREVTDALKVCRWFHGPNGPAREGKTLAFRLDTHGGRFLEGLDWKTSVEALKTWTHKQNPSAIVRHALDGIGIDDLEGRTRDEIEDKYLFGTGVTAANVIAFRQALDAAGYRDARIVASSGFDPLKSRIFGNLDVPVDIIGTGSFLPKRISEAQATADIVAYTFADGTRHDLVKAGREHLLQG